MIPPSLPAMIRASIVADELDLPSLADRMERLALRPFDKDKDPKNPKAYEQFEKRYGPVKSVGKTPDGFPIATLPEGTIGKMLKSQSDEGWDFQGYAFRERPKKPKGDNRGPYMLSRSLGIPAKTPWMVTEKTGGPLIEHEATHLSQFADKKWDELYDDMTDDLNSLAKEALGNGVDIDTLTYLLSPFEIVARVAEVARVLASGARPPKTVDDYQQWVHNKTTKTSPLLLTKAILDLLEMVPSHKMANLTRYDPKDLGTWTGIIGEIQKDILDNYRIPSGYRGKITKILRKKRSPRSTPPSRPSSRLDTA